MVMVIQPVYRLTGPKGRRYHFIPMGDKRVRVERWEPLNGGLISRTIYSTGKARWLWKELTTRLGYSL